MKLQKLAKKLAQFTNNNQHTEAYIALANYVGNKQIKQWLIQCKAIRDEQGSMPIDLFNQIKTEVMPQLLDSAREMMDQHDFERYVWGNL